MIRMRTLLRALPAVLLALGLSTPSAHAQDANETPWVYKVRITNITKGIDLTEGLVYTPILLAVHRADVHVFELGEPASEPLAILAEGGDTVPLAGLLRETPGVRSVTDTGAPLLPGSSVEVEIPFRSRSDVLSLASMLLPTNDGFIALDAVQLPWYRNHEVTYFSPGYDAGSERNDELCASIPGPHCGGEGYSPVGGEGKVHIHNGIHGVGDLAPENYDWRNPTAKISIRLVRK